MGSLRPGSRKGRGVLPEEPLRPEAKLPRYNGMPTHLFDDRSVGQSLAEFQRRALPCQTEPSAPCVIWEPREPVDYFELSEWLNDRGEIWCDNICIIRVAFYGTEISRERARGLSARFGTDLALGDGYAICGMYGPSARRAIERTLPALRGRVRLEAERALRAVRPPGRGGRGRNEVRGFAWSKFVRQRN